MQAAIRLLNSYSEQSYLSGENLRCKVEQGSDGLREDAAEEGIQLF